MTTFYRREMQHQRIVDRLNKRARISAMLNSFKSFWRVNNDQDIVDNILLIFVIVCVIVGLYSFFAEGVMEFDIVIFAATIICAALFVSAIEPIYKFFDRVGRYNSKRKLGFTRQKAWQLSADPIFHHGFNRK